MGVDDLGSSSLFGSSLQVKSRMRCASRFSNPVSHAVIKMHKTETHAEPVRNDQQDQAP